MRSLLTIAVAFLITTSTYAGQCYQAYQQAKQLQSVVEGVYHTSESDDDWTAFAAFRPAKKITKAEIKKALNLKLDEDFDDEELLYRVLPQSAAYEFMRNEVLSLEHYAQDDPTDNSPAQFKKLIKIISKKFGKKVRLIQFGAGDGDSFFVGDHMIIMIMDNGCILGLKALTVWT